jgi:hypothetical protein
VWQNRWPSSRLPARWRGPALALILAALLQLFLLWPAPLLLHAAATLLFTGLLPGILLVELLVGRSKAPPTLAERAIYSVGAGYGCMVAMLLLLSYLPGGLTRGQTIVAFDLLILTLAALTGLLPRRDSQLATHNVRFAMRNAQLAALLLLIFIAGFLRFTNLGYAEFQGDEARLALRAAEVIQGYENALFVHKKGPTEILLPTAVYVLRDRLNEAAARLPFTIANLGGILAVWLLGRRLFGPVAGWAAALLLAVDGYLLAFGRVVQYQSIVFLMDVLTVLVFVRLWQQPQALARYLTLAAIFWATGLLSHYEAALVIFPVGYLLWRLWREGTPLPVLMRAALAPMVVGGGLLALFYLPFVLNPAFLDTFYYLTDYRMGGGRIFNHVAEFFARTTVYSSTYYLLTLIVLTVLGLWGIYRRARPQWLGWLMGGGLLAGLAITFVQSTWLAVGGIDWLWLFFAAALTAAWLMPKFAPADRLVWLWFGAPMILALFFTAIPNTHVYSFFIPWALVAGRIIGHGWRWLTESVRRPAAQAIGVTVATLAIVVFGFYAYWLFVYNREEVLRTWPQHRPPGYWTSYEMPVEVAIFGFPLNNGWKAIGTLYADGLLQGNYDTNTRDVIAEWYTRGDHYCVGDDLNFYMLTAPVEPTLADEVDTQRHALAGEYTLASTLQVQGRPALEIYARDQTAHLPDALPAEQVAGRFDEELTGPHFERNGPVSRAWLANPIDYRFGESIWLRGYRLAQDSVAPGEVLPLTLYWETTQPITQSYTVFAQLIDLTDLAKAGQSDHQPGCARHPTNSWLPGDLIADRRRIVIDPDARPGQYTLLVGVYSGETRLDLFTADGQPLGNGLELTQVAVQP